MTKDKDVSGYVATMATAMTVMTAVFKTMAEIDREDVNRKAIILGTMVGVQAVKDMLDEMFTGEPLSAVEFASLTAIVRQDIEKFMMDHK